MGVAHVTPKVIAAWLSKFLERHRSQFDDLILYVKIMLYSFISWGGGAECECATAVLGQRSA